MIYVQLDPAGLVTSACSFYDTQEPLDSFEPFPLAIPLDDVLRYGKNPETGGFDEVPARPSDYAAAFDWAAKTWVPSLADALAAKIDAVSGELARRSVAPIIYGGSPFDANDLARARITGVLMRIMRGDGLPDAWEGWKDHDNVFHWVTADAATVQVRLSGLSRLIEDREQVLIATWWRHKDALRAKADAGDFAGVQGYDISTGWLA